MASRGRNEICILQEFCQKFKFPYPSYEFTTVGDEKYRGQFKFNAVSKVSGTNLQGEGTASTKAEAKRLAAEKILIQLLEVKRSTATALSDHPNNEVRMLLSKYCTQSKIPQPKYEVETISIEKDGESVQSFEAGCIIGNKLFSASAPDREEALRLAARNALRILLAEDTNIMTAHLTATKDHNVFEKYREITSKKKAGEDKAPECQASRCKKFPVEIRNKALHIISQKYDSKKNQALEILSALQLEYKLPETPDGSSGQMKFFIEVKYEAGISFTSNSNDDLYLQLISYFTRLLHVEQMG